jgi:hypothetical protein
MKQLLLEFNTTDPAGWKREWDAAATERMEAGLTVLQIWRDADAPSHVLVLLQVSHRPAAEAWLRKEQSARRSVTAKFLETL